MDTDRRSGDAPRPALHERSRMITAGHARRVHPGPPGEPVVRELQAQADLGHRFGGDASIPRITSQVPALRSGPGTANR